MRHLEPDKSQRVIGICDAMLAKGTIPPSPVNKNRLLHIRDWVEQTSQIEDRDYHWLNKQVLKQQKRSVAVSLAPYGGVLGDIVISNNVREYLTATREVNVVAEEMRKWLHRAERIIPSHMRENVMGDLQEEIGELTKEGISKRHIRRMLVWELWSILKARILDWFRAKVKSWRI